MKSSVLVARSGGGRVGGVAGSAQWDVARTWWLSRFFERRETPERSAGDEPESTAEVYTAKRKYRG